MPADSRPLEKEVWFVALKVEVTFWGVVKKLLLGFEVS